MDGKARLTCMIVSDLRTLARPPLCMVIVRLLFHTHDVARQFLL